MAIRSRAAHDLEQKVQRLGGSGSTSCVRHQQHPAEGLCTSEEIVRAIVKTIDCTPKLLGAELFRPHPSYICEMAMEPVIVHDLDLYV